MNFDLDPHYRLIQDQARKLARAVEPLAAEADEMSQVHPGVLAALRQSGLCSLMVPAEFGGAAGRPDPLAICVVREALMASSSHADSLFALQGIGSYAITLAGSPGQRAHWLPRVGTAEVLAALAITEEHVGSDVKNIATRATATANGLMLQGTKSFISNGGAAGFYLVDRKSVV